MSKITCPDCKSEFNIDDVGPIKMREEIGYTIQSFRAELGRSQDCQ